MPKSQNRVDGTVELIAEWDEGRDFPFRNPLECKGLPKPPDTIKLPSNYSVHVEIRSSSDSRFRIEMFQFVSWPAPGRRQRFSAPFPNGPDHPVEQTLRDGHADFKRKGNKEFVIRVPGAGLEFIKPGTFSYLVDLVVVDTGGKGKKKLFRVDPEVEIDGIFPQIDF